MGLVKTTVYIPDSLFNEAKSLAKNRGITLRQLIEDGLRHSIRQYRSPAPSFRLKDGSFKGKGLEQDLTWSQIQRIIYEGRGE